MFHQIQDDERFLDSVIFSYESTFYVSGKVKTHNFRIWGSEDVPPWNMFVTAQK
jgi:hypothetical protein